MISVRRGGHRLKLSVGQVFIAEPNWVDLISLSGLLFALSSVPLMLAGKSDLSLSLLLVAMSIDFIDGALARKYNLCRDFGRYLDGFIDIIDYLIAPTLFLYLRGFDTGLYMAIMFMFVAAGVIRLSVFNEVGHTRDADGAAAYLGMPVFWSLFVLATFQALNWYVATRWLFPVLSVVLLAQAILMVYRKTFLKFKNGGLVCALTLVVALAFAARGLAFPNPWWIG